jgi:hypothetical protein
MTLPALGLKEKTALVTGRTLLIDGGWTAR